MAKKPASAGPTISTEILPGSGALEGPPLPFGVFRGDRPKPLFKAPNPDPVLPAQSEAEVIAATPESRIPTPES